MMFGQVQKQAPTDRISCEFPPKWENAMAFILLSANFRWIYNRCADGHGAITPRDVLVLGKSSKIFVEPT